MVNEATDGISSVLLVDTSCSSLYVSSMGNTNCLASFSTSSGSVVGGTLGGIIAGAIVTLAVAFIILMSLLIYKKKKNFLKDKEDELPPHPMSRTYKGKPTNSANAEDGEYYEDMATFNKSTSEDNYEDPSALNRSKEFSVSDGYEIPDCRPQNIQKKVKSYKKESGRKKSKGKNNYLSIQ